MRAPATEADKLDERQKEFELWLLAALAHGRARLGATRFTFRPETDGDTVGEHSRE